MQVKGYGVVLSRLTQDRIELVRQWRNAESISRYMEYQEHISPEMQQQWFDQLHPLQDFYFVIEYLDEPIGLIHISHINWAERSAYAGLFIYDDRYVGTPVPVLASLSLVDMVFGLFPLEDIYAKVMADNEVAVRYNINLGFISESDQQGLPFQRYHLTPKNYFEATRALRRSAKLIDGSDLCVEMPEPLLNLLKSKKFIHEIANGIHLLVANSSVAL